MLKNKSEKLKSMVFMFHINTATDFLLLTLSNAALQNTSPFRISIFQ